MPTIIPNARATAATQGINADRRVVDMADRILLLEKNKNAIALIASKVRKKSVHNPDFDWLEDERTPAIDRVNNGAGYAAGATSIVVDNGPYFSVNSTFRVQRTGEVCLVTGVSTNTLTVTRGFGSTSAAAMVDNDQLTLMGGAAVEGASPEAARGTKTETKTNRCEIVRDVFEVTKTLDASLLYGGNDRDHQRLVRGIEHAVAIEEKFLFGEKALVTSGATPRRTTGGLDELISTNDKDFGGVLTLEGIMEAAETDFRYGADKKMLFGGAPVISQISLLGGSQLRMVPEKEAYGLALSQLITPHGEYLVHKHHLLEGDTYSKRAYIVDIDNVGYAFLQGRDTKLLAGIESPGDDVFKDEYLSEVGFIRMQEKTHGRWKNASP